MVVLIPKLFSILCSDFVFDSFLSLMLKRESKILGCSIGSFDPSGRSLVYRYKWNSSNDKFTSLLVWQPKSTSKEPTSRTSSLYIKHELTF